MIWLVCGAVIWGIHIPVKFESNAKTVERKCKGELELQLRMIMLILE